MKSVTVAVQSILKREGIKYRRTEFAGVVEFGFVGENGCFRGYVEVDEDRRSVHVQTVAPVRVQPSKWVAAAELVARINYRLLFGNLELNMDTGAIACRTSTILGEGDLHPDVMKHLLYGNWATIDRHLPVISAVLFGDISPKEVLSRARQERPDSPDEAEQGKFPGGRLSDILRGSTN